MPDTVQEVGDLATSNINKKYSPFGHLVFGREGTMMKEPRSVEYTANWKVPQNEGQVPAEG